MATIQRKHPAVEMICRLPATGSPYVCRYGPGPEQRTTTGTTDVQDPGDDAAALGRWEPLGQREEDWNLDREEKTEDVE